MADPRNYLPFRDRRDHHWVISRVLVALSVFFCLVLCGSLLDFLAFSFGHCIVYPSSIYDLFVILKYSRWCIINLEWSE